MRIEKGTEGYIKEKFAEKLPEFGTFSAITKMDTDAKRLFLYYKGRAYLEILLDGVKDILGSDKDAIRIRHEGM